MIVGLPTETEAETRESFGKIMSHVKKIDWIVFITREISCVCEEII